MNYDKLYTHYVSSNSGIKDTRERIHMLHTCKHNVCNKLFIYLLLLKNRLALKITKV